MHIQMPTIQVHELAPPTCVLKILIDSFPLSYLSPYVKFSPFIVFSPSQYTNISFVFLPYTNILVISPLSLISLFLSSFVINDHKGSKYRQYYLQGQDYQCQSMRWGSKFQIWFKLENICQRYSTRFDPRTSFFTPPNKGYLVPC